MHDLAHYKFVLWRQPLKIFWQGCEGIFRVGAPTFLRFQHACYFLTFPIVQPMGRGLQPLYLRHHDTNVLFEIDGLELMLSCC